jgi:maltose O-acetyltransferase
LLPPFVRRIFYKATFNHFGSNVFIGEKCYFKYPWKIRIGNDVSIGRGSAFFTSFHFKDVFISIDDNEMTGPNLTIFGAGHPIDDPLNSHVADDVHIESGCYIGGNVTIRYGVRIGQDSIVAAGSVVTKSLPPNVVAAGNPAKVIRELPIKAL